MKMELVEDLDARRMIGAYYTPDHIADVLVRWANPDPSGRILDPSFGGCSFLGAAVDHARSRGLHPRGVFGVDVDAQAFRYAAQLVRGGLPKENLWKKDFFCSDPDEMGDRFAAVVGNPPYIRHHRLNKDQVNAAQAAARAAGVCLPRTSDTWAYFVVHATSFLEANGRLAFVLPEALTYAHYAKPVVEKLKASFGYIKLIRLTENIFEGVQTNAIVLACWDFGDTCSTISFAQRASPEYLERVLMDPNSAFDVANLADSAFESLPSAEKATWDNVISSPQVHTLGSVATIRLGIVTGANDFFIRPAESVDALLGPGCHGAPIIPRAGDLRRAVLNCSDLGDRRETIGGKRLLMIEGNRDEMHPRLLQLINEAENAGMHQRYHTSRRRPWYQLTDRAVPQAFLPYMGTTISPMTLTKTNATSTNGVHRVWWRSDKLSLEDAIVGSWTTAYQLSVELLGRAYGGGVLKIEPGAAHNIRLPVVCGSARVLADIDAAARDGAFDCAVRLADEAVLKDGLGLDASQIGLLRRSAQRLRQIRRK